MVNPKLLCRKHLLGEHVEIHMLCGSLIAGRSIAGFLQRGLLEPQHAKSRHLALVEEMTIRGYSHKSPLPDLLELLPIGCVDQLKSLQDLKQRCKDCHLDM